MSNFFKHKRRSDWEREQDKQYLVDAAILLGLGLPSVAMLTLGSTGVFIGGLLLLVPGPHQPLALPVLATSLPVTGIGAIGSASVTGYIAVSAL